MVILGWILDKPLPLLFDPFETVVSSIQCILPILLMMINPSRVSGPLYFRWASGGV